MRADEFWCNCVFNQLFYVHHLLAIGKLLWAVYVFIFMTYIYKHQSKPATALQKEYLISHDLHVGLVFPSFISAVEKKQLLCFDCLAIFYDAHVFIYTLRVKDLGLERASLISLSHSEHASLICIQINTSNNSARSRR